MSFTKATGIQMKAFAILLFLLPTALVAQTTPRDTVTVPDSVTISGVDISRMIFQIRKRREQIQLQVNALAAEDSKLLGRVEILQAILTDSTLQRRPVKGKK